MLTAIRQMVYRLEHAVERNGPWVSPSGRHYCGHPLEYESPAPSSMPLAREELGNSFYTPDNARYAYPSIEVLQRWWCTKALHYAHSEGFTLGVYRVNGQVELLDNQVIFSANDARHVVDIPLVRMLGVVWLPPELKPVPLTSYISARNTILLSAALPRSTSCDRFSSAR